MRKPENPEKTPDDEFQKILRMPKTRYHVKAKITLCWFGQVDNGISKS